MRFRTGLLIGLAVGYYYGAKAGRERYHQIDEWLDRVRTTTTYQDAVTKLNDGWREAATAMRHLVEDATRRDDGIFVDPDPTDPMPFVADPTLN